MPILEVVLRQLRHYGTTDAVIAVNHLARLIEAFFGDGESLDMRITYSTEDRVLGTAGPLRLIDRLDEDFLVMNGDLLTTVDFSDLFAFHRAERAIATIAVFRKEVKIDLGVLKTEDKRFLDYIEKPNYTFDVSMGIYAFNRSVLEFIPEGRKLDMPELMLALRDAGKQICCYRGDYDWLDIGRIEDYQTAVDLFEANRARYLPS